MNDPTEVRTPEYFNDVFPVDAFPQYEWVERPNKLPNEIWMSETTHRDGQQGGLPLNVERSRRIYDILCRVTNWSGAIRQAEFFPYQKSDRDALQWALGMYKDGAPIEPTTWIRGRRDDVELICGLGVRETGLLCSASDYHTFHKFNPGNRRQAANLYLEAVEIALAAGIQPRIHLEDTTRAPVDFVQWLVDAVLDLARKYPESIRPRFRICDTLGIGLPYEDVALPRSIPRWISILTAKGVAGGDIEFHPHNDMWLVVANCLSAIRAGCGVISGTCLGTGERTGNAPLEAVMAHLMGMGYWRDSPVDLRVLNDLVALYHEIGEGVSPKYPMFGRDAFVTRAGIHADGINKFWPMYAPFNAPVLVGRNLEVALTKDSGLAGLIFMLRQELRQEFRKDDERVLQIFAWMEEQFQAGRCFPIRWYELETMAGRLFFLEPQSTSNNSTQST